MTIKVREIVKGCRFEFIKKGDWIDLRAAEDVVLRAPQAGSRHEIDGKKYRDVSFDSKLIPLGIAMALPEGYEAHILPRSSTYKTYGIVMVNSKGLVDGCFSGNNDQWLFPCEAHRHTKIDQFDRICQFRIQLSQKATFWQKLKWLFTSSIKFEWVDSLDNEDRNGVGSTGKN